VGGFSLDGFVQVDLFSLAVPVSGQSLHESGDLFFQLLWSLPGRTLLDDGAQMGPVLWSARRPEAWLLLCRCGVGVARIGRQGRGGVWPGLRAVEIPELLSDITVRKERGNRRAIITVQLPIA